MKTRKFTIPSKPTLSDAGAGTGRDHPRERRTLGLRYGGASEAQGSDLAR